MTRALHDIDLDGAATLPSLRAVIRRSMKTGILDAAEACFATHGIEEATMGAIARRAGVAVGTLYNYFDSRTELVQAVLARRNEELDAKLEEAQVGDTFATRLSALVDALFEYCALHDTFFASLLGDDSPTRSAGTAVVDRQVRRVFDHGIAEGVLDSATAALHAELTLGTMRRGVLFVLGQLEEDESADATMLWQETAHRVAGFVIAGCT
jgi:AcrR family transcriptional regulator